MKVMVGYMSFNVREYIPPPLRCHKCQRYGHTAHVCKGKQRCGRCGGDHAYGEGGSNVTIKRCNCGGNHTAAYRGCEVWKKAVEVQKVKSNQKITYPEAVKICNKERGIEDIDMTKEGTGSGQENTGIVMDRIVLFLAYVINCSEQAKTKTEKIKIIVKAAAKFFNMKDLSWEKIHADLNQGEGNADTASQSIT